VRVALPQEDAARVRATLAGATGHEPRLQVRLADESGESHTARLARDLLGATAALPSAALSEQAGGSIQTDPQDAHHLKPVDGVVLADLALPSQSSARLGTRAWVRIDHGSTPLVVQLARRGQQLFLKHFDPQ
jgi:putative peptide zinc metalloprotease protein